MTLARTYKDILNMDAHAYYKIHGTLPVLPKVVKTTYGGGKFRINGKVVDDGYTTAAKAKLTHHFKDGTKLTIKRGGGMIVH